MPIAFYAHEISMNKRHAQQNLVSKTCKIAYAVSLLLVVILFFFSIQYRAFSEQESPWTISSLFSAYLYIDANFEERENAKTESKYIQSMKRS